LCHRRFYTAMQLVYRSKFMGRSESSHETKVLNVRMTSVQCWYELPDKVYGDPRRRLKLDVSEPCVWTRLRSKGGVMFSKNHFGEPPHGILLQSFARAAESKPQHSRNKKRDQKCKYNRRFLVPHLTAGNPHITSASSNFVPRLL
jgi:hypothetical protein